MDAPTEAAVIEALRRQGKIPMRAQPARRHRIIHFLTRDLGGSRLRRQEVAEVTRELATMLGAGLDLDRALRFLVETAPSRSVRAVIEQVRAAVRDGGSLAAALARHPASFPRIYIGTVRAGEAGGTLAPTLERLAVLLERERSLAATLKTALIYPLILVIMASGSIVLLLTAVLPQFVPMFEQNGATLPRSTMFLIGMGNIVSQYGLWIALLVILLGFAARSALRRPGPRLAVDRLVLRLPVIGSLTREVVAARFTRTLGTLLVNGVPLIAAIAIARDAVGNRAAVIAVEQAGLAAAGGAGLSRALSASGVFPVRTARLLRLGEETAQLGSMCLRAAEIHEERTRMGTQRLVSLLVPAITILMGAVIGWIVSSLLLAMLSLNDLAS
jgi:general secretion pathway protein F